MTDRKAIKMMKSFLLITEFTNIEDEEEKKEIEKAFEAAISALEERQERKKGAGWTSVRDGLPEDQEEVLVCTLSKNGMRNIDKGYMAIDHFIHRGRAQVTHWMPLPEMPKEDK